MQNPTAALPSCLSSFLNLVGLIDDLGAEKQMAPAREFHTIDNIDPSIIVSDAIRCVTDMTNVKMSGGLSSVGEPPRRPVDKNPPISVAATSDARVTALCGVPTSPKPAAFGFYDVLPETIGKGYFQDIESTLIGACPSQVPVPTDRDGIKGFTAGVTNAGRMTWHQAHSLVSGPVAPQTRRATYIHCTKAWLRPSSEAA